jgi:membrane peptidoglycan carboxypeptidase
MAYNPTLVTGAWVGGPSPAVRFRTMDYGRGAALALPIVGNFWYQVSIDPKSAKMTQKEFKKNEKIIADMGCPTRLGFSPDKYFAVMQDSTKRDSMLRTGFRGLRGLVEEMFPEEAPEGEELVPAEEGVVGEGTEENKPDKPKPNVSAVSSDPKKDPKATDPKAKPTTKPDDKAKKPEDPKAKKSEDPKAKKQGGGNKR